MAGRSKVEQDQVLTSGFEGRTSMRPAISCSSSRPRPKTGQQSGLHEHLRLLLGPQSYLLGFPLPPSGQ
ncbi:hypothetical protein ACFX2I_037314 [Malus domestica]